MSAHMNLNGLLASDLRFIEDLARLDDPEGQVIVHVEMSATFWARVLREIVERERAKKVAKARGIARN